MRSLRRDKSQKVRNKLLGSPVPDDKLGAKPYKINYWCKDEKFADDGSNSIQNMNALRRLVADLRAQLSKLTVAYNDLKSHSQKESQRLKNSVNFEKKRRVSVQEVNLEKSSSLMQELVERDKRIVNLQNEVRTLREDRSEVESIN